MHKKKLGMINKITMVAVMMLMLGGQQTHSTNLLADYSNIWSLVASPLGNVKAAKSRGRKKRKFNMEQAVSEVTEAWAKALKADVPITENLNCD